MMAHRNPMSLRWLICMLHLMVCATALDSEQSDTIQDIRERVFATDKQAAPADPNETRKLLWSLDGLLSERSDFESPRDIRWIKTLISVSDVQLSNCSLKYLRGLRAFSERCPSQYVNLIAYLNHYQRVQLDRCKQHFNQDLQFSLGQVKGNDVVRIDKLRRTIEKSKNGSPSVHNPMLSVPIELVADRLYSYPLKQDDRLEDLKFKDEPVARQQLASKFQSLVEEPCNRFKSSMSEALTFYRLYVSQGGSSTKQAGRLDARELNLLGNEHVCSTIVENKPALISALYAVLKKS